MKPLIYIALGALAYWYFTRRVAPTPAMPLAPVGPTRRETAEMVANNTAPTTRKVAADLRSITAPSFKKISGIAGF